MKNIATTKKKCNHKEKGEYIKLHST